MDMHLEILKGEGPDIFQSTNKTELASKGVLEDLTPYFAASPEVKEEDILPAARNVFYEEGKLYYIFTEFHLRGFMVGKGITDNGAWTPEEFLALADENPDSLLFPFQSGALIYDYMMTEDMGAFIDWQERQSFFNSERYIELLKGIERVTQNRQPMEVTEENVIESVTNACQWLYDKKVLVENFGIRNIRTYIEFRDAYEEFAEFAGYPSSDDTPHYLLEPNYLLAINSASQVKEGAWAFLEYLLSRNYQSSVFLGRRQGCRRGGESYPKQGAVVICWGVALCFLTNPKSGDYQRLPDLQEHSYCVADRPYTSTTYPDIYERGEEPVYYISQDNHLMSKGELTNPDEEWQDLGQLTEAALTKENFDDCFRDDKSTGWEHVKTAAKIRENNEKAWSLLYDYDPNEKTTPILYYVLQQKNGEVYLAYGYDREPLTTMLFAGCLNLQHCQWRSCRRITLWRML